MKHQLFIHLISRARQDLEKAEELAKANTDMADEDLDSSLFEVRARVLSLEARVEAIEERGCE